MEDLTETVKRVRRAHTHNMNINDYARDISEAFKQLNTFLSKVHRQVRHDNPVLDDDIKNAKKAIKKYMHFFREKFPEEPVTPKAHVASALEIWHGAAR